MPNSRVLTSSERLERLKKFAWWLDACILIPGTQFRIGIESLVGLLPGFGDAIGSLASGYVVWEAWKMGASGPLLLRMLGNIGLELLLGTVPILGDVMDFVWKANQKNMVLLERELAEPVRARRRTWGFLALAFGMITLMVAFIVGLLAFAIGTAYKMLQGSL